MQQFPNYLPQMNNYNQPIPNQYIDRSKQYPTYTQYQQPQMQQPMTSQQFPVLGKIVDSLDVVKATDIPMDGNMYYFPKADGTEIFAKQWLPNGTTQILTFKPFFNNNADNMSGVSGKNEIEIPESLTTAFMQRFDEIAVKIDDLEKQINKNSTTKTAKPKKEVEET